MKFGLACEGVTDHVTLTNILCGYFSNSDLDENITELQPALDETEQKQGEGGWRVLLQYLTLARFREDILNTEYIILQIDSDIAKHINVAYENVAGNALPEQNLIDNIITVLVERINSGHFGFYEQNAHKIIFAISVHSLECWLVAHYVDEFTVHNCFDFLKKLPFPKNIKVIKKRDYYDRISAPFLERQNIELVAQKSPSFNSFIQQLQNIPLPL